MRKARLYQRFREPEHETFLLPFLANLLGSRIQPL